MSQHKNQTANSSFSPQFMFSHPEPKPHKMFNYYYEGSLMGFTRYNQHLINFGRIRFLFLAAINKATEDYRSLLKVNLNAQVNNLMFAFCIYFHIIA